MIDGFTHLKSALSQKISLYLPQPDQPWRIRCDTCDYAVGGALEQRQDDGNWHPVAFCSRKLQGEKANGLTKIRDTGQYAWTPRKKETYAIVCCPLKFQSWIGSQRVTVRTDHSPIVEWYKEDVCTISGPVGRRGRWHECLSRFNLFIEYRRGEDNEGADALSRWAYPAWEAQARWPRGSEPASPPFSERCYRSEVIEERTGGPQWAPTPPPHVPRTHAGPTHVVGVPHAPREG